MLQDIASLELELDAAWTLRGSSTGLGGLDAELVGDFGGHAKGRKVTKLGRRTDDQDIADVDSDEEEEEEDDEKESKDDAKRETSMSIQDSMLDPESHVVGKCLFMFRHRGRKRVYKCSHNRRRNACVSRVYGDRRGHIPSGQGGTSHYDQGTL